MDSFEQTNPNSMSDSPNPVGVGGVRLSTNEVIFMNKCGNKKTTNKIKLNRDSRYTEGNSRSNLTNEQVVENNKRVAREYTDKLNKNVSEQLIPTMNVFGMDLKKNYNKNLQDKKALKDSIETSKDKKEKSKLQKRLNNINKFTETNRKFLESYLDSMEEALGMNTIGNDGQSLLKMCSMEAFKKDFYDYSVGLTKDMRQERRGNIAIYSKDLSYIKDMCGYKSIKLVDFSDNPFIADIVNVSSFCLHEMTDKDTKQQLVNQLDFIVTMLTNVESMYGLAKSVRLNSYRLVRLIYSLFIFNAKPDLAILCGFILLQLQLL